ncbi:hypothetical protein H5410_024885 [Solanum commersonii]|uniref:Uncharacterized protein n=1 Tax=Solanum commersonii TaxID=4109 RepID=A0A9J5ZNC7_SOLCO|nr:hypothetical protein H5410_024885 [Solanum commersonii]
MGVSSDPNQQDGSDEQQRRSEIYTYEAPWHIYAMNWSVRKDKKYRLAIASLLEQYPNRVEIVQLDDSNGEIRSDPKLSFEHPYPPTKVIFIPDKECQKPDLIATSSDYLRIWRVASDNSRVEIKSLLNNNRNSEFSGPLTSFDWNEAEPRRIGTSSIDTTCTIWDIERETVDTQLIAHDKEVYDIAWGGVGVFASVSADGSVRVFDLRDKEHSTIIYESSEPDTPLVRLGWNKQDPRYMATIIMDSAKVVVLDIRFPTLPVVELQRHQASVNAIAWAPHSSCHICTAGDDSQALIWDLSSMGQPIEGGLDPILAYTAGAEIEQLQWSSSQPDWVAIAFSNKLQILRLSEEATTLDARQLEQLLADFKWDDEMHNYCRGKRPFLGGWHWIVEGVINVYDVKLAILVYIEEDFFCHIKCILEFFPKLLKQSGMFNLLVRKFAQ